MLDEVTQEVRVTTPRESHATGPPPTLWEVLAHVGAVSGTSAALFIATYVTQEFPTETRLTIALVTAVILLSCGWWLRDSGHPRPRRLVSVLWFLSVGVFAAAVQLIVNDVLESEGAFGLVAGIPLFLFSGSLYLYRRMPLQQVAVAISAALICSGLSESAGAEGGQDRFGLLIWVLGAGWIALTRFGLAMPRRTGFALGSIGVLAGSQVVALEFFESTDTEGMVLGLISAGALLLLSVAFEEIVLLGMGIAGLFVFASQTLIEYLRGGRWSLLAMLIGGTAVLLIGIVSVRRNDSDWSDSEIEETTL
jgi:hypothetical protein